MSVIWKFHLDTDNLDEDSSVTIEIPHHPRILCVQTQFSSELMLWAQVDPNHEIVKRKIWIYGTGLKIPEIIAQGTSYLGTVQLFDGKLVLHVYG